MSDDDQKLIHLLKTSLPPVGQPEPRRDLWPVLLARLQQPARHVPWFDWALAGLAGGLLLFFPELIPVLLYHM